MSNKNKLKDKFTKRELEHLNKLSDEMFDFYYKQNDLLIESLDRDRMLRGIESLQISNKSDIRMSLVFAEALRRILIREGLLTKKGINDTVEEVFKETIERMKKEEQKKGKITRKEKKEIIRDLASDKDMTEEEVKTKIQEFCRRTGKTELYVLDLIKRTLSYY
ncbi:hypothetical protein GF336_03950 [Candidatus Woesearchaeota archaeon]|nr:hypothetical protein [Candidatus Woesearchaeota archaeon]